MTLRDLLFFVAGGTTGVVFTYLLAKAAERAVFRSWWGP